MEALRRDLADLQLARATRSEGERPEEALPSLSGWVDVPGEMILSFFDTGTSVIVFTRSGGTVVARRITDLPSLQSQVMQLKKAIAAPGPTIQRGLKVVAEDAPPAAQDDLRRLCRDLYDLLLAPSLAKSKVERLVLLPDGVLHHLPFEVLMDEKGQWLVERTVSSYASSMYLLAELRSRPRTTSGEGSLFAVSDPDLGTSEQDALHAQGLSLPPLPSARVEVRRICAHVKAVVVLEGADATEAAVRSELAASHPMLHFATHGLVPDDLSWLSRPALVLSRGGDATTDGLLDADEIAGLRLDARLVVLSACQTAMGDEIPGEGLQGLTRAFLVAGADRVVASLWSVSDTDTEDLMEALYRNLKTLPPADALRAARIEVLRRNPHPFFWAPFVVFGA